MNFYFFLAAATHIPNDEVYQHCAISIAEGFKELNISFDSNVNYWFDHETSDFLFKKTGQKSTHCICIYSSEFINANQDSWKNTISKECKNVLLDTGDWKGLTDEPIFEQSFDLILRCHFRKELLKRKKYTPWAFGLTNRILSELKKSYELKQNKSVYISYRVSQNVRQLSERILCQLSSSFSVERIVTDSLDTKILHNLDQNDYWNQTGRRHHMAYFKTLNSSLLSFAFGGILEYKSPEFYYKAKEKIEKLIGIRSFNNFELYQFDSWRMWETLASNSCPIMLDLENWGCILPVIPSNIQHYIGVKNLNFDETSSIILTLTETEIKQIGKKGQEWVVENYSPKAVANRLLELISKI